MSSAERAGDEGISLLYDLSKEALVRIIIDDAKNWLAHDGLWFQALERRFGMEVPARQIPIPKNSGALGNLLCKNDCCLTIPVGYPFGHSDPRRINNYSMQRHAVRTAALIAAKGWIRGALAELGGTYGDIRSYYILCLASHCTDVLFL